MAYVTYTTRAIVCGSRDSYTSDRSYLLFTEDAGMLWASARSVRTEASKQRTALQDFSVVRISLVKGKSGWRIGSVESQGNPFMAAGDRSTRAHVCTVVRRIRQYIHGSEVLTSVYQDAVTVLAAPTEVGVTVFEVRMLYQLGYVPVTSLLEPLLAVEDMTEAIALWDPTLSEPVAAAVKQAASASHL